MFSKNKNTDRIDSESREQYEYARKRIQQKKGLMRHFILFLAGSVLLIILNPVLGIGKDFFIQDWFVWAILIWALFFLVHVLNVFLLNKFMGKEWEDQQLEKLKALQKERIEKLKKQALTEVTVEEVKAAKEVEALKKNDLQLPPEEA